MVVFEVLGDQMTQSILAEGDAVVEAFVLERAEETLDEGIAVGRGWRDADGFDANRFKGVSELGREGWVAIHDEEATLTQEAAVRIGEISSMLDHPFFGQRVGDANEVHSSGVVMNGHNTPLSYKAITDPAPVRWSPR